MPYLSKCNYTPPAYAEMAASHALMEGTTEVGHPTKAKGSREAPLVHSSLAGSGHSFEAVCMVTMPQKGVKVKVRWAVVAASA